MLDGTSPLPYGTQSEVTSAEHSEYACALSMPARSFRGAIAPIVYDMLKEKVERGPERTGADRTRHMPAFAPASRLARNGADV
jgi:hypothetical protein